MQTFVGDVNCKDQYGYTPLVLAIANGNCEAVSMLARLQDVDVNSDVRGQPPLIWAIRHEIDQDDILRVLVQQRSVDVNISTPW